MLALQSAALAQEPGIGSAKSAKNKVEGVVGGQTQNLRTGSQVYSNETVRTGDAAVADLVFLDDTNLSVGPISEVRLDKFVYDPTGSSGKVVLQATKGAFRFVTGSQDKRAYEVRTPYGSLGVRGTIVELVIKECVPGQPLDQCGVTLKLVEGEASFTTLNGQTVDLSAANTVMSVTGEGTVSTSSQAASILNFAAADTTGTSASVGGAGGGGGGTGAGGGGTTSLGGGGLAATFFPAGNRTTQNNVPPLTLGGGGGGGGGNNNSSNCNTPFRQNCQGNQP
jgi:hypothetical protein